MRYFFLSALLLMALSGVACAQGVPIVFDIPADANPSNIFVQFLNTADSIAGTYRDNAGVSHSLLATTSYSMATITSPISVGGGAPSNKPAVFVTDFYSGRVYVNFGRFGLTNMGGGYMPAANDIYDPNYKVRYQYFEPTIGGADAHINLSYIDFTAISMSMEAVNAPNAENNPQRTVVDGETLVRAVAASSHTPSNNVLPHPADILPSTNFARVISPQLNGALYHNWTNYLRNFLQGKTNSLKGLFAGVGHMPTGDPRTQKQSYDFKVTFNAVGDALLIAQPGSGNGYATGIPSGERGPGVGDNNVSVTITYTELNKITGIYGNNPAYTIVTNGYTNVTSGIENDYFGWVVGDLVAGISWGFLSSTVDCRGTLIGNLPSCDWWGGWREDGTRTDFADTPAGMGLVFDKAQPGQPELYHSYAAFLNGLTLGYGFPLQDRMDNNLLHFNTDTDVGSYLLITINSDYVSQPRLSIRQASDGVVLRWPATDSQFQLKSETNLFSTSWIAVPGTPVVEGSDLVVTSSAAESVQFYRLER